MFSTVPPALGKLGTLRPSFPQFPQPLRLDIENGRKDKKQNGNGLSKFLWTSYYRKRKKPLVPADSLWPVLKCTSMAGFQVFTEVA